MLEIEWGSTYIIKVPKSYLQVVQTTPTEILQLDINQFRLDLKDLEASIGGISFFVTHSHVAPISVGGVTLARVVEILAPYTIEFEDGQYAVNLVGANSNIGDRVVVNQVSVRSANSAGLTFSEEINEQSFQDAAVWIDVDEGKTGTEFPRGTPTDPVNNIIDGETIAINNNFHRIRLRGTLNTPQNLDLINYDVVGGTPTSAIIIGDGLMVNRSSFLRCAIVGSITGRGAYQDCSIAKTLGLSGVEGIFDNCALSGPITLDSSATEPIVFKDCVSAIAGSEKPILDCNGTQAGINFRRYSGGLDINNFNNPLGAMTLDLMGSEVVIKNTCNNGSIICRGVGKIIDESGNEIPQGESVINGNLTIKNVTITETNGGIWSLDEKDAILALVEDLHNIRGLDSNDPAVFTKTSVSTSRITLDMVGDGKNITTVTRQ